jgi:DNA polymerase gamma 2
MKLADKLTKIKQFVDLEQKGNVIKVRSITPLFQNLLNNVREEYLKFHSTRESPSIPNFFIDSTGEKETIYHAAYLHNSRFTDAYTQLKGNQELPFSITEEVKEKHNAIECIDDGSLRIIFPKRYILRTSYFVSGSFSRESFYHMQRQHKIFWMKYGSYPGKYKVSDQKVFPLYKLVNIQSSVTDYAFNIEGLKLFSLKDCSEKEIRENFVARIPNHKKEIIPDVIKSVVDLQTASMALLLDALNLTDYYTAFHRRTAPFQLSIIASGSREHAKKLDDLARYIELLIAESEPKIKVLNDSKTRSYDEGEFKKQCAFYDKIGVPYNILLDKKSLDEGFMKLRNRNTTLSEKIHLSDVTNYLTKIFTSG